MACSCVFVVSFTVFNFLGDCVQFLSWILNSLHLALGGTKKTSTVISKTFRGSMTIYSKKIPPVDIVSERIEIFILTLWRRVIVVTISRNSIL